MHTTRRTGFFSAILLLATSSLPGALARVDAAPPNSPGTVVVTGVAVNNSSAKIDYNLVPGAQDYRVVDLSNPVTVKYAGMVHLNAGSGMHFVMQKDGVTPVYPYQASPTGNGPNTLDVPATEIEDNLVSDGLPHTLVVQALDALGPVPPANLYDINNQPLVNPLPPGAMLGSNAGATPDGNYSINGQGPSTNAPHVIAQSAPFVVQADSSVLPLPSESNATQSFLDTFDSSEAASLQQVGPVDPIAGVMTYTLNAGTPKAWTIQYQNVDTTDSMPMLENGHFMDVLFDGGTPGTNNPLHVSHAVMAMSPNQTADLSGGKLLHLTMEVDGHDDARRWMAFNLSPANDPLVGWYTANAAINKTDTAFFAQFFPDVYRSDLFDGPTSQTDPTPLDFPLTGAAGQAPVYAPRLTQWGDPGLNLDNRSRFDVFITQKHLAIFENGQFMTQSDIPNGGLPFSAAKVYFSHYLYHTANDHNELLQYTPWEQYWINDFPWSDERHWDNMGFEVLPAADVPADWSTLASLIHMPVPQPPVPPSGTPTATATQATGTPATSTATPTHTPIPPTNTPSSTSTPSPTNTPNPTNVTILGAPAVPAVIAPGGTEQLYARVESSAALPAALVDFEVYNSAGVRVYQTWKSPIWLRANTPRWVGQSWTIPTGQAAGVYRLKVGVFSTDWLHLYAWDDNGGTFAVQ